MKIRNGFVSNSSSSSFIIGCKRVPNLQDEALNIWFGIKQGLIAPDIFYNIFNNMKEIKATREETLASVEETTGERIFDGDNWNQTICEEFHNDLWFHEIYGNNYNRGGSPEYQAFASQYPDSLGLSSWKIQELYFRTEGYKEKLRKKINEFFDKFEGYVMMQAEFSDNDGELGSETEHGSHWRYFPVYQQFSHH
jgi:hypothetical protein